MLLYAGAVGVDYGGILHRLQWWWGGCRQGCRQGCRELTIRAVPTGVQLVRSGIDVHKDLGTVFSGLCCADPCSNSVCM